MCFFGFGYLCLFFSRNVALLLGCVDGFRIQRPRYTQQKIRKTPVGLGTSKTRVFLSLAFSNLKTKFSCCFRNNNTSSNSNSSNNNNHNHHHQQQQQQQQHQQQQQQVKTFFKSTVQELSVRRLTETGSRENFSGRSMFLLLGVFFDSPVLIKIMMYTDVHHLEGFFKPINHNTMHMIPFFNSKCFTYINHNPI